MTSNLVSILQNKRAFRQRLAARPIVEKLALLDALRERALALYPTRPSQETGMLHEAPPLPNAEGEGRVRTGSGEIPWPAVDAWHQQFHRDLEHARTACELPECPDYEAVNGFLVRTRHFTFG